MEEDFCSLVYQNKNINMIMENIENTITNLTSIKHYVAIQWCIIVL